MSSDSDAGASVTATEHDQLKRLGKYEIQRKLGAGGMGTVFLAMDEDLRRTVALKVLPRDRAENAILVRRFKAEAQAAAQLHHRNIVGVYEAGTADGLLYIALEYIDGSDALDLIHRRGILPVKRSIEIIRGVAEALRHAYEKNIVHRDIKPSNLMIAKDGEVKLADMGLARSVDETLDTSITRAGTTVGTVDYMAPEQARDSKAADIRSDLYSLGCTWYHLVTGEPPFGDGDVMFKVQAHALKAPPDPRRINDRIPEAIVAVIQRLMAKKPQDRYQTPQELLDDLANPNLHRQGVTSDLLASLGKSHDADEYEVEEEELSAPAPAPVVGEGVKGKAPGRGNPTPKKGATSTAAAAAGAAGKQSSARPVKRKTSELEESLIGQALDEEDASSEKKPNRKKTSGDRALPDRVDAKDVGGGISQMSIDPAFFKIGFVILIIGAVIGAIAWVLKSGASSNIDDKGSLAGIVDRNNALNSQPEAPMVSAPSAAPMPQPEPMVPAVPVAPTIKYTGPQDESPFAGIEESSGISATFLPAWVPYARGPAPDDIPVVKVRRFRTEPGELASAAQVGRRDKVVLEFVDEGPHTIPAAALSNVKWLGIRGRNVRPALIVSGATEGGNGVLGGSRGSLKVEGVDLFWNASEGETGALLSSQGGEVLLRNATVTIAGAGKPSVLQLRGVTGVVTRAVFENVMIRNDRGTGIRAEGPGVELVTGNLLSLTGGTFLAIDPADQAATGQLPTTRLGRFFQSTVVTGENLLVARHKPGAAAPPAAVDLRFEQFQGIRHGNDTATSPTIRLVDWPDSPPDEAEAARPAGFKLQGTGFRLAGWGNLTQPASGSPVTDAVSWRLFWRHQAPSDDFSATSPAPVAAWNVPYSTLSADKLTADLRGSDSEAPGSRLGKLPRPQEGLAEHIAAFAGRPQLPAAVTQPAAGPEVRFDLKKASTFNRFLNSECPDNARVVAFGAGLKFLDPVVLKKKSLTIVFEQSDGAPLELQPQSKSGNEKSAPEALFTVTDGGRLEFVNARFEVTFSKGKQYPKRFAQVDGSALVLTRCSIEGSQSLDAPPIGLVQVAGASGQFLSRGTFLRGKGPLVELAGPRFHARIENSVLVSGGDAFVVAGGTDGGTVDIDSTTISAGGPSFRIAGDQTGAARLFVSESLFVPPMAGMAALFADEAKGAGSRITWWGMANAYSSKLADFVVAEGHPAGKQEFERDWTAVWGPGHDLRPASGEEAVVLDAPLGKLGEIKAADYTLKSGCLAAFWDGKGEAVGADVSTVGPTAVKGSAPTAQPKPTPATPPKKPGNGF